MSITVNINNRNHDLSYNRINRVLSDDPKTALHMGIWDKIKDLFRAEKKKAALATLVNQLYSGERMAAEGSGPHAAYFFRCCNAFRKLEEMAVYDKVHEFRRVPTFTKDSGLQIALKIRNVTVKELVLPTDGLKSDEIVRALTLSGPCGYTPLFKAMAEGNIADVTAFGELLDRLTPEERAAVLNLPDTDGEWTMVDTDMAEGNTADVTAFCSLPDRRTPEERVAELNQPDKDGFTSLYKAMLHGHTADVIAFEEKLTGLTPEQLVAVLNQPGPDGRTPLFAAMEKGHARTVTAFGRLLPRLTNEQRVTVLTGLTNEERMAVLKQPGPHGRTPLYIAMRNGHADAVMACGELLTGLTNEEHMAVLTLPGPDGLTPLFVAMAEGRAAAATAFGKQLTGLTPEERVAVLTLPGPNGARHCI